MIAPAGAPDPAPGPVEADILALLAPVVTVRFVDAAGARLRIVEGGAGAKVVLLLHGRGHAATMWFALLPRLLDHGLRVLSVDLPGFGASTPAPLAPGGPEQALRFFVEPVEALLAAGAGGSDVTVIGHSLGGFVALELALRRRVGMAGLVLVDAMGLGPEMGLAARAFFRVGPERIARAVGPRALARLLPSPPSETGRRVAALEYELLSVSGGRPVASEAFARLAPWRGPVANRFDRLGAIEAPVLLLWGERDQVLPPVLAARARERLPHATATTFSLGHSPHLEDPAAVLPALLRFL